MTASVNEVPASDSSVPQPTGEAHALERAAYALGCSEGLLQDVRAALWDRREAVSEARLAGESLTLAHLLAEEALLGERGTSLRSSSARRWLSALWLVREASSEAPALSGPHWHAVLSCLDSQTLTTQARASLRRWSEELRGLWARQGGLAASSMVVAPSHEAPDTGLGAQLGRLASHALLHHAGLTAGVAAPLISVAKRVSPRPERTARGRDGQVERDRPCALWLSALRAALEERSTLVRALRACAARDRKQVAGLPRCAGSTLAVLAQMERTPVATLTSVSHESRICFPTTLRAMHRLLDAGIVREITGRRSKRVFAYEGYVRLLEPDLGNGTAESPPEPASSRP
jgi:hypothetical protein